jgi:hypothetical protein
LYENTEEIYRNCSSTLEAFRLIETVQALWKHSEWKMNKILELFLQDKTAEELCIYSGGQCISTHYELL